jgi:outer membrane receptor protein involved in Fe transport
MRNFNKLLLITLFLWGFGLVNVQAQGVKGRIIDGDGNGLAGASIAVKGTSLGTLADANGNYEVPQLNAGTYTLVASFIGFKTKSQELTIFNGQATLDFTLSDDLLNLDAIVVTGTFNPQSKLESTVSITTLDAKMIEQQGPRSSGSLIDAIPGFYVESNLGETGNNVYPRGLPIGTGSLRYTALREDGLNNFEISDKVFFQADGFTKVDLTIDRVEGLRGGNAVIFSSNTPGGIINFVSKTGGTELEGDIRYTYGTQNLYRVDFNVGGPLTEDKKWRFNIGGFYRYDSGLRDFTGPANVGGQVKINITRMFNNDKGYIRFFGKALDDKVAFWTPVPYQGYDNPQPLAGIDNLTRTTLLPSGVGEISVPDPLNIGQNRRIPLTNQADIKYKNIGMEVFSELGNGWSVRNQLRYVHATSQSSTIQIVSNPIASINLLLGGAGLLAQGFVPRVNYVGPNEVNGTNYIPGSFTGEIIPTNRLSAGLFTPSPALPQPNYAGLAGFFGIPLTNQGINPNGINGNGMLIPMGLFVVPMVNTNLINNLQFTKQAGNHALTFGGYISAYNSNENWNFNTILTDVTSNPRLVDIGFYPTASSPNPNAAPLEITRGGVFGANFQYEQSNSRNITAALFFGDEWKASDRLNVSLGFRYELNNSVGSLQNTGRRDGRAAGVVRAGSPITVGIGGAGGLDGNPLTVYDNNADIPLNSYTNYTIDYKVWGANLGFNYKLNDNSALFLNGSRGTRYANSQNFLANKDQGVVNPDGSFAPISLRNPVEEIFQGEFGYRVSGNKVGIAATAFASSLRDAPFTLQSQDANGNIKLDVLLYDVNTVGLEVEFIVSPVRGLRFNGSLSLQQATYKKYPDVVIIETNINDRETPTTPTRTVSFVNNRVERVPPIQLNFTADYTIKRFNIFSNIRYISARQGNRRNTFKLPGFAEVGVGASYRLDNFTFSVQGMNIFSAKGITEGNTRTQDNIGPNAAQDDTTINTGQFVLPASANFSVQFSF